MSSNMKNLKAQNAYLSDHRAVFAAGGLESYTQEYAHNA
jgi:hypothetical protein